jgi:hypothetical protein
MWGNPTREREIYYSASGNYISAAKQHFQPRKIPHNTKSVPQKSASFSVLVHSTNCFVQPKTTTKNPKIAPKTVPKITSIFVPNPYGCTDLYRMYGFVHYSLPQQKNISAKNSQKFFLGNRAHFPRKTCLLCCSLSSLKHSQKISLTLLPMPSLDIRHVLHTTQCILL